MEQADVQKAVADFTSKLKPVTAEMKAMAEGKAVAPPPPVAPIPAVAEAGEDCVTPWFKNFIISLPADYIGKGETKDLVEVLVTGLPECKE